MIGHVIGNTGVEVTGGNSSMSPNITGLVRWNHFSCGFEVMDSGMNWLPLPNDICYIGLSYDVQSMMTWVHCQMTKEKKMADLCEKHPALASAKEQFEVMTALVLDSEKENI